jgi:hypothetical protein
MNSYHLELKDNLPDKSEGEASALLSNVSLQLCCDHDQNAGILVKPNLHAKYEDCGQ